MLYSCKYRANIVQINKPQISLYLDTRRAKKDSGLYPVKLRIYKNEERRLFPLPKDLSESDFEKSYLAEKPRGDFKDLKFELIAYEAKAKDIIDNMGLFSFELFEKKMFRPNNSGTDVIYQYNEIIQSLRSEDRVGSAKAYQVSRDSFVAFMNDGRKAPITSLYFETVTPALLNKYEGWMIKNEKSKTTVGIYLRSMRAVFNKAIADNEIDKEIYPFGKRRYKIPAGRKTKKALAKPDLNLLFTFPVDPGSCQEKAKDFWFLSYQCNGMNMADMLSLRCENFNLKTSTIIFERKKTALTTKEDSKQIVVPFTPDMLSTISKYGNVSGKPTDHVFPILSDSMNEDEKYRIRRNFIRFINQHIKTLAKAAGVTEDVSSNWSRHSYTTSAIRSGASMEYIQESLGHQSITTTMNYWGGFEVNAKRDIQEKLMDFLDSKN